MASITTLVEETPFAHVVDSNFADRVCAYCMIPVWERVNVTQLSRCARCKFTHYCNMKCQKKDWRIHKVECSYLSRVAPRVPEALSRLLGRIITTLRHCGDKNPAFNGRIFSSLESHILDIERNEEKRNGFMSIAYVIKDYLPSDEMPSSTEIFNIFCRIIINTMVITDSCLTRTGIGVYLGLSALDHSCKPDAFVIFSGTKAILRSLNKNIKEYNNNLRIPYCDLLELTSTRCKYLQLQHNFICNCEICQNVELDRQKYSLRCSECTDGFCPYSPDDEQAETRCKVCGEISVFNFDHLQKLYQQLTIDGSTEKDLNELIDLYHKSEEVFSPYNVLLCKFAEKIMISAMKHHKYDEAAKYAEKTLICYRTFYPKGLPPLPARMLEYAKLLMLQQDEAAFPILREALKMIRESYGSESNFALTTAKLLDDLRKNLSVTSL
ncbi:MYND finger family protein [Brugia malayi]|nr:MYND finger family protein [Brugia malayi]VIO89357.1 MYND finger family protein [Brugia malayi]